MTRHFFKVIMPGCLDKLNLPLEFSKKMKQEKSEWAILTSRIGKWKINVCRNSSEGTMCFQDGWPQFVNHHSLSIGDFVVFEHTANLHFNVSVFDSTECEKDFLLQPKKEQEHPLHQQLNPNHHSTNTQRESDKQTDISDHSQDPHFVLRMKPYHAYSSSVDIPSKFVMENKLQKKKSATLRGPGGRKWAVKLVSENYNRFRLRMSKGWHDFYVSQKLKKGDVCVFTLNPTSAKSSSILLHVKISHATTL